jgi:hypothetical protein
MYAGNRYANFVANVLGTPGFSTNYQCVANSTATCSTSVGNIWAIGYTHCCVSADGSVYGYCTTPSCASTGNYDVLTSQYMLRWGNWDSVNAASQFNTGEVPSALASYANPVPTICTSGSLTTCPPSFFTATKPPWWGSLPWPAAGPDVSGGNIGQCSGGIYATVATISGLCTGGALNTTAYAGHANANPAMTCALVTMGMPPDGTGPALTNFNAATCYGAAQQTGITSPPPPIITIN